MTAATYFLETMGCQMNVLDSELVEGELRAIGLAPAASMREADVVLINTCSVRQHAEDKVWSRLGELRRIKRARPDMVIGVIGCMAERDGDNLLARCEHVDLLCGPGQLVRIPQLLDDVLSTHGRPVALAQSRSRKLSADERSSDLDGLERLDLSREAPADGSAQAYIRVQRGCDKFCTYCVVPFTRGPEISRPPANIVAEARRLCERGVKEITLLGQTVNSYAHKENGRTVRFGELLERVHETPGLQRLRFVTNYPGDFDAAILEAMRDLPKVCEYLHIPAQSGSNAVLKRMNRDYTAEQYIELMDQARAVVPGIALAGDFIVGFCGETDADFEQTVALVERIRYKNLFVFKYSPRPSTVADRRLPDDVPIDVKRERNSRLLEMQKRISLEDHQRLIGRSVEVLVEGYSKAAIRAQEAEQDRGGEATWRRSDQLTGRTRGDRIVVFPGDASVIGRLVKVRVTGVTALTLHGELERPADALYSITDRAAH
jgi:tRNA-2-methylthio-N6-dimethylallyladenosine synthase